MSKAQIANEGCKNYSSSFKGHWKKIKESLCHTLPLSCRHTLSEAQQSEYSAGHWCSGVASCFISHSRVSNSQDGLQAV